MCKERQDYQRIIYKILKYNKNGKMYLMEQIMLPQASFEILYNPISLSFMFTYKSLQKIPLLQD
jgi:hypothetical protein